MLRGKTMNIVAHNLTAINAQRQFGINLKSKTKSTEKLSSGYKINRAADDAACLAISEKMRRQIRGLKQGVENTQDGVSLCQVADGALAEVNDMLHRISELSVQSANGTNSDQDRQYIQEEVCQILQEIDRIGDTTTFNERKLFDGREISKEYLPISASPIQVSGTPSDTTPAIYVISADSSGISINGDNFDWSSFLSSEGKSLSDVPIAEGTYLINYHGLDISIDVQRDASMEDIIGRLNGASFSTEMLPIMADMSYNFNFHNFRGFISSNTALSTPLTAELRTDMGGLWIEVNGHPYRQKISWECPYNAGTNDQCTNVWEGNTISSTGSSWYQLNLCNWELAGGPTKAPEVNLKINDEMSKEAFVQTLDHAKLIFSTNSYSNGDSTDSGVCITSSYPYNYYFEGIELAHNLVPTGTFSLAVKEINQTDYKGIELSEKQVKTLNLWIQSGSEPSVGMYLNIDRMDTGVLGICNLDVSTVTGAEHTMDAVKIALQKISANRAKIGAQQNRLEHTIANEENIVENTTAAESRIRDTDMAEEMVKYSKDNILEQVGYAMMAQANQSKEGVLALLR